ncbi:MAG TPA: methyltransferase domain-containing protein [bacterium]|nr:methyltransferase domain-containing protein [bacterium]
MLKREECPLCGAPADEAIHLVTSREGYELFRCPACGVVYSKVYLDDDRIFAIYDEDYARHWEQEFLIKQNRGYADRFFGERERGRLLEVGCGTGQFLRRLKELGYDVRGVEVSLDLAKYAADLDVKVMPFEKMRVPPPVARFDYVVTFHVLEHFVDSVAAVQRIAKMLKPDGVWFNYMPNVAVAMGNDGAHGSGWIHFNPSRLEHLTFFDEKTIRVLADKAGLEVYLVDSENDDFWSEARLRKSDG